ncbi:DUF6521 family protein [Adlercreutzia muris]|uniref:Uncharacterized protein n=1 Tax=Adlercreutzia muris TaxID=1796610 RepID=A0A7C8BPX9_9ACTN|nr:three component ABC system middle component [Adlercreutzia muris]KAB1640423.1 hypothetical protein F8D48_10465 [Adlercreutzia muris]MCR2029298.1 DUF6521 family protein [Adlercreutzia muris]MCU7585904.1 DUF6521 family protein [Adlercreutzia muris]
MSSINKWEDRAEEVAYLLNPAFCGVVLCQFIETYQQKKEGSVPVALLYIVLPLVLFPEARSSISDRKKFANWACENQRIVHLFAKRARALVFAASEAIELLMACGVIAADEDGEFRLVSDNVLRRARKRNKGELHECVKKAEQVANWFARTSSVSAVYATLGVRP